jgi:hypothetical protein
MHRACDRSSATAGKSSLRVSNVNVLVVTLIAPDTVICAISPSASMRSVRYLPVLATVPRSGTWFLRFAISFLCHLERGGRITDRLTGRVYGDPKGELFDFARIVGGPLFHVRGVLPTQYLFIGHTVCPGFRETASSVPWWSSTPFHVRGYDYFGDGWNYARVPVELAAWSPARLLSKWTDGLDCVRIDLPTIQWAAAHGPGPRAILVYRDPVDQAASYFWYCRAHKDPLYRQQDGRILADMSFEEYLLKYALVSYAKQFISFQEMARRFPGRVMLLRYDELMAAPVAMTGAILDHLGAARRERPLLADAVHLARASHLKAIEAELGRSLDGNGEQRGHMRPDELRQAGGAHLRSLAMSGLAAMGVRPELFGTPPVARSDDDEAFPGVRPERGLDTDFRAQ